MNQFINEKQDLVTEAIDGVLRNTVGSFHDTQIGKILTFAARHPSLAKLGPRMGLSHGAGTRARFCFVSGPRCRAAGVN